MDAVILKAKTDARALLQLHITGINGFADVIISRCAVVSGTAVSIHSISISSENSPAELGARGLQRELGVTVHT